MFILISIKQKLAFPQMHLIHNHKPIKQVICSHFAQYYTLFKLPARQFQPSNTDFIRS